MPEQIRRPGLDLEDVWRLRGRELKAGRSWQGLCVLQQFVAELYAGRVACYADHLKQSGHFKAGLER